LAINYDTHNNVSVVMKKELHKALKILAEKNHRTVSAEICVLVEKAIKEANIEVKSDE
jgi:predicted DNA-binding protein